MILRDEQQDRLPQTLVGMHHGEVTVMPGLPADRHQVAGHIQSALAAVLDVVQRRRLPGPPATHAATPIVASDHVLPDVGGHQAETLQLRLTHQGRIS